MGLFYTQRWSNQGKLASSVRYTPLLEGDNHLQLELENRLDMPVSASGSLKLRLELRNLYSDIAKEMQTTYNTPLGLLLLVWYLASSSVDARGISDFPTNL